MLKRTFIYFDIYLSTLLYCALNPIRICGRCLVHVSQKQYRDATVKAQRRAIKLAPEIHNLS
jgi:hypothetical protein